MGCCSASRLMAELVDLDLDRVDARFVAENFIRRAAVFVNHRADAALDSRFDERAHLQQLGFQLFQFFDKMRMFSS